MARAPVSQEGDEYFVLDPTAEEIAGKRLRNPQGEKQTKIRLSPSEAAFAIANGSISTEDPEKSKHAKRAIQANLGTPVGAEEDEDEGPARKTRR